MRRRTLSTCFAALSLSSAAFAQVQGNFLRDAALSREDGSVTVVANDPRPLSQALDAITHQYGWAVDYEDPPYEGSKELLDVTAPAWKASHPDGPRALQVRGGWFQTSFADADGQSQVLGKLVADYNASGNPGQFELREHDGHFAIVGIGRASILDTPVQVPGACMNFEKAIAAIVKAVTDKTGARMSFTGPTNLMVQTTVDVSGNAMPARDALHEVLSQARIRMYWRLNYAADYDQTWFLNLQLATRVEYDAQGRRTSDFVRIRQD